MIGKTISHYRIVEKIGEGGMGVVYVAEDTVLGRRVAIKTLTIKPGQNEQHFRTRFLREARAVSALSHPHIATIHDYGETKEGEPYIVMELVKGETLGDLMLGESLTIARALEIIKEVTEALGEAHRNGVVHRDIKPSNVAINHRGEVKVLDFGLAKQLNLDSLTATDPERQTLLTSQTQEGVIVGTPLYLSPEQALGSTIDARSDLFSVGTLLYECIAGRPPFDGTTRMEICTKVIRDDPTLPSQLNADVPPELDRVVLKALEKKPEARYQTAEEMLLDLHKVSSALPGSEERAVARLVSPLGGARATGALATLSDIFRRPRIPVGYIAAAVALVLLIGFAAWRLTRTTPYEPKPEAKRLYDLAVNALREGAYFKSSKILQQAVAEDDRFALAHARLAEAWTELDVSDKAKDALIRAKDLVPNTSVLAEVDALRLNAISATVSRDFPSAVENYRRLAASVPENEKAYALVDLGRAYEKNEKLDKAIESYQEATKRNEHYAAAFLRLGVALRRNRKYVEADTALNQANRLFDMSNEVEGTTEVLIQKGLLLSQQGKAAEAQAQLQQALDRSVALENQDQRIRALQELSNTCMAAGDTAKAREYSQQATQLAQANGMENLTVAGLIEIGNSYFIKGDHAEAEKNFNEALRLARLYNGKFNEARAVVSLASLRMQQNNPDAAREYAQRALNYFQQGSYGNQMATSFTILGRAYDETGDYENAEKTFQQLLDSAQQTGDMRSVVFAHEGLGTVFLHADRIPEALAHFAEDYKTANANSVRLAMNYAADYRATASWRLGRYEDALAGLAEALKFAEGGEGYKDLLTDATWSGAALALSQKKFPEASSKALKALELAGSEFKLNAVRAGATLGLAQARSGQAQAGRKRCDDAVTLARTMRDPRPLSDALLALAEAALAAGDAQTAFNSAAEALQRFAAAKQFESEWWALAIQARASEKLGDKDNARQLASMAEAKLSSLEQKWGSDNYKSYLTRPDVEELHRLVLALART
jgi:tetratricopeptide (TPR) repeat protein/tRNA A-37 threonylcarbamoyl transferase component Bud32